MSVILVSGNIFEAQTEVITDANNSIGISGAGLAGAFARRYPLLAKAYNSKCKRLQTLNIDGGNGEPELLPPFLYAKNEYDNYDYAVVKFPTMIFPGSITKEEHIDENLKNLKYLLEQHEYTKIALPALGCGIGRFPFEKLEKLIRKYFDNGHYIIHLYKPS